MDIDVYLLIKIGAICNLIPIIAIAMQYYINRSRTEGVWWLYGFTAEAIGLILMSVQGDPFIVFISNSFIVIGALLIYLGILKFIGKKPPRYFVSISLIVYLVFSIYFGLVNTTVSMRSFIASFICSIYILMSASTLFTHKSVYLKITKNINASFCLAIALLLFTRSVLVLISGIGPLSATYDSMQIILFILAMVINILLSFGFIIMANEKLNGETKEAKENFETIFRTRPDAVSLTHLDTGEFISINDAFLEITGYTRQEVIGKTSFELHLYVNTADRDEIIQLLKSDGNVRNMEIEMQIKDGTNISVLISARRIKFNGIDCIIFVAHDISERIVAEEAIKESERRYRLLADNSMDLICKHAMDGTYIYVSPSSKRILGFEPAEMLGRSAYELFYKDDLERISSIHHQILKEKKPYVIVYRILRKDGSYVWVETWGHPILDEVTNEVIEIQTSTRDITERVTAQEKLQQSEKKYRYLVENSHDIIYTLNVDTVLTFLSPSWKQQMGYDLDISVGRPLKDFIHPVDYKNIFNIIGAATQSEQNHFFFEFRLKDMSGGWNWYCSNAMKTVNDKGDITGIEGIAVNITERKKREEEILYLTFHDILTGLYNRLFYEEEKKRLDTRRQLPLSIIMGDINGLKLINDAFGHAVGDQLLRDTAKILSEYCRKEDILARIGGDEFCLLLPKTTNEEAKIIVDRIEGGFEKHQKIADKYAHYISISLGYATKTEECQTLDSITKIAEDYMYKKKLIEHKSMHNSIITSIRAAMYEKDMDSEEHFERIINMCNLLAGELCLDSEKTNELQLLCALHDIGKISIDDDILFKPDKLTDAEWKEMKKHPERGNRIAMASPELKRIADGILSHHERWDGTGYPQGISKEDIPLNARIIALIAAYDAMTHDRPYRKAMSKQAAIEEIVKNAGTQFDPNITQIFVEKILKNVI